MFWKVGPSKSVEAQLIAEQICPEDAEWMAVARATAEEKLAAGARDATGAATRWASRSLRAGQRPRASGTPEPSALSVAPLTPGATGGQRVWSWVFMPASQASRRALCFPRHASRKAGWMRLATISTVAARSEEKHEMARRPSR